LLDDCGGELIAAMGQRQSAGPARKLASLQGLEHNRPLGPAKGAD
jgi:hypothetical protein